MVNSYQMLDKTFIFVQIKCHLLADKKSHFKTHMTDFYSKELPQFN